jgi:hypothetical protein
LLIFLSFHAALAALPRVDFDRMGKVDLAGSFVGLDIFQNSTSVPTFDPSTSTLLSRFSVLSRPSSQPIPGGRILAGCALGDTFYLAGSFSFIESIVASNVASYTPSSGAFAALGTNGPNGEVNAVFCDQENSRVWVGGQFTSPGSSVAIWDTKSSSWSKPPFTGLSGAEARVVSITANLSQSSIFFAGSFIVSFQGSSLPSLNGTNNPNVPFPAGTTPFSSSLVPIPLENAKSMVVRRRRTIISVT